MSAVEEAPDPNSHSGEPLDAVVLGDASSRKLRHTLQKNNMARAICQRRTRHLDSQRRNMTCKLNREEKELRHQLLRLQEEQKVLTQLDSLQDECILGVTHANLPATSTDDVSVVVDVEPDVINPYPVALRCQTSTSCGREETHALTTNDHGSQRRQPGRRRLSVEFEDLQLQTSTGKIFPPLHCSSMRPLALGMHASVSMVTLTSPVSSPREKERDFWAGAPEAIQSVRRPRKSVSRMRLENLMAKSATYREHGAKLSSVATSTATMSSGSLGTGSTTGAQTRTFGRSSSLKERRRGHLHSASTSGECTRTGSWKEGRRRPPLRASESVDSVREAFVHLDVSGSDVCGGEKGVSTGGGGGGGGGEEKSPAVTPRLRRVKAPLLTRQSSSCSLRDYIATPETKSSVWGTVTCLDTDAGLLDPRVSHGATLSAAPSGSLLQRRRRRHKNQPELPCLPPITPDGATLMSGGSPLASPRTGSSTARSREGSLKKKTGVI